MRKGLLTASVLACGLLFSTVACNNTPAKKTVYTIEITNKAALEAEWLSDDLGRSIDLTITKDGVEQNAQKEINAGNLTFTVSDNTVVKIQGRTVSPASRDASGTAIVTAKYGDKTDSFTATITYSDPHGKSADDPLTVAEAIAVCESTGTTVTPIKYYTRGYVFNCAGYDSGYQNITFDICDNLSDTSKFVRVYRAKAIDEPPYDITKIDQGSEVLIEGNLVNYGGNLPEYDAGCKILTATEGLVPQVLPVNVAGALAAAQALPANNVSFDKYEITGYITAVKPGSGFYMSDTKGAVEPTQDQFLVYYGNSDMPADALVNAKVKVLDKIKHYVSTSTAGKYAYETASTGPEQYTLLEPGDAPVPEYGDILEVVTSPAVGTKYKLGMKVTGRGDSSDVFLLGTIENHNGATSIYSNDGVDAELVAAATEGKYNVKLTYADGSVKYLNGVVDGDYTNISFDETASTEYTYDTTANTLFFEANGHTTTSKDGSYYFGTFGKNVDARCSLTTYITGDKAGTVDVSQFPLHFCTKGERPALTGVEVSPKDNTVDLQGKTEAQIVQLTAKPAPATAILGEVAWASNDALVTVENGKVTVPVDFVAEDADDKTVTITATAGGYSDTATIVVTNKTGGGSTALPLDQAGADFTGCTSSDTAMPAGCTWTYITNNPSYPNPSFNSGGFKFSYVNQGLQSAELVSSDEITVTINVGALNNKNSTTEPTDPTFTVYGLAADGSTLDTKDSGVVSATGNVVIKLAASSMVGVKIMLTGFGWNGSKQCNLRVDTITLA